MHDISDSSTRLLVYSSTNKKTLYDTQNNTLTQG